MKIELCTDKVKSIKIGDFVLDKNENLHRIVMDSDSAYRLVGMETNQISYTSRKTIPELLDAYFSGGVENVRVIKSEEMILKQI